MYVPRRSQPVRRPVSKEEVRILVVEDDRSSKTVIAAALLSQYDIVTASNGAQAWKFLHEAPLPDLVITDVMMPELDGIELVRRMKDSTRLARIPVIILTARAEAKDYQKGLDVGADDYLTKPLTSDRLLDAIRRLL